MSKYPAQSEWESYWCAAGWDDSDVWLNTMSVYALQRFLNFISQRFKYIIIIPLATYYM